MIDPPVGLLAELTHRCPLGCAYCSNPLDLVRRSEELDTATWRRVMHQAAALGVLQVHLSGGEPAARDDLEAIVAATAEAGLYANLITSGVGLDAGRLTDLARAGLRHLQLSLHHADPAEADRLAVLPGAHVRKLRVAHAVREAGLALTVNVVVHRANLPALPGMIALAESLGAVRLEVAHVQYHGWALANRAALLPSPAQVRAAGGVVADARARLGGRMAIDHVLPDHFGDRPKPCMGGWGRKFLVVTPRGAVLPCHAADGIPGLAFDSVTQRDLAAIWTGSAAFQRFRGVGWMTEPCRSCDRREVDWGGCRCQALALTGDVGATDPVCRLSPDRRLVDALLSGASGDAGAAYRARGFGARTAAG